MNRFIGRVLLTCIALMLLPGCSNSGIRRLEHVEMDYYAALSKELKESADTLEKVLTSTGRVTDDARYTIARLDDSIDKAKAVYAVREVLTPPKNDKQRFIQSTRNSLIMYVLADGSRGVAKSLEAQAAADAARRQELLDETRRLASLTGTLVESEKQLHAYLNEKPTATLHDVLHEVGRQIDAFDAEAKKADQSNSTVAATLRESGKASAVVQTASSDLDKFIDIWTRLNQTK